MRFVVGGFLLAAAGMALLPTLATGLAALIAGNRMENNLGQSRAAQR